VWLLTLIIIITPSGKKKRKKKRQDATQKQSTQKMNEEKTKSEFPVERQFWDAAWGNRASEVKLLLVSNPKLDVNWKDKHGWDVFHTACINGYHEVVQVLLADSRLRINGVNFNGDTGFLLASFNRKIEVVKFLLKDSRVDVNYPDILGCTPTWWAVKRSGGSMLKWMVALRGDELDVESKGCTVSDLEGSLFSPRDIAISDGNIVDVDLLDRLKMDRALTRHEVGVELGLESAVAASIFAAIVLLCDGYLVLKEVTGDHQRKTKQFFSIATRLPMELQMSSCFRLVGSTKNNILMRDSEPAFKSVISNFH
jgi:hypothetical protein